VSIEEGGGSTGRAIGFSFFQTNLDQTEDVAVNQGQCIMKHPLHGGDLRIGQLSLILHSPLADG
jgi:hypothetical protein